MEMNKLLLIINPISGVNSKEGLPEALSSRLSDMGYDVDVQLTKAPGHATKLAESAVRDGVGTVVVCGGDGTINESAQALCGTGVRMGIIPSGSGNGLARHLGIPVDEVMSLDIIRNGHVVDCDSGIVNGMPFFCTFGIGFDAHVAKLFAGAEKRGRMTYIKLVMAEFSAYEPKLYRITANGQTIEQHAFVVAVCNASQYGNNAFIAPAASVCDGMFDIVIVEGGSALSLMHAGFDVVMGMTRHNRHVKTLRASEVLIELQEPITAHIDGEPIEVGSRLDMKCLPGNLKVFAANNMEHFTPFITPIDLALRDWGIAISKLFR